MCMGKPKHIHSPSGERIAVADFINHNSDTPYDVFLSNLKLEQIQNIEFDTSELDEYRVMSAQPPAYSPACTIPLAHSYQAYPIDDKPPLYDESRYASNLSEKGIPLPVTISEPKYNGMTNFTRIILAFTIMLGLFITSQSFNDPPCQELNRVYLYGQPGVGSLDNSYLKKEDLI
ncbi:CYFA0S05e01915g1_1 [Cyberlindnera fabianii]|uniref:CYFA0S05e01915g1_1 n=1 Tax=Cyberlindnera fabianii TaxID=36022 RepID=A0A061B0P9_CYBFA|nr:CYFA0S05e01915g1_1 [Cyberlindnera fabianii]